MLWNAKKSSTIENLDLTPPWSKWNIPSADWWKKASDEFMVEGLHCTPDISTLDNQHYHLLFACDDLMQGRWKYKEISQDCVFLTNCYTRDYFEFWEKILGMDKLAIPLQTTKKPDFKSWAGLNTSKLAQPAKIKGQLLAVRGKSIILLDRLYFNTVQYERKKVHIHVPHRRIEYNVNETGKTDIRLADISFHVWMYVAVPTYWSELIDIGFRCKPVELLQAKAMMKEPYYYFPS